MVLPDKWLDTLKRKRTLIQVIHGGDNEIVVSKHFVPAKQRWVYECEDISDVRFQIELTSKRSYEHI